MFGYAEMIQKTDLGRFELPIYSLGGCRPIQARLQVHHPSKIHKYLYTFPISKKGMYTIKNTPEDFQVKEIPSIKPGNQGDFTYFWLMKRNITTSEAIRKVASRFRIKPGQIGFSGTKDRLAVTEQLISIKARTDISIKGKNLEVTFFGKGKEPLRLGMLLGNNFDIKIRDLKKKPKQVLKFLNLYGEQRFGTKNAEIGKDIIKKDFKSAVKTIQASQGSWEDQAKLHLEEHKNDFVGAIRTIPREIAMMFVHSYQSLLWNRCAEKIESFAKENLPIPIIGFETDIDDFKYREILKQVMKEEDIKTRDFIVRQIPGFSYPGGMRMLYANLHELKIGNLNKGTCKVSFRLDKGCYATVAIRDLLSPEDLR